MRLETGSKWGPNRDFDAESPRKASREPLGALLDPLGAEKKKLESLLDPLGSLLEPF